MEPSTIAQRLREARERAGLSKPELAERAGCSAATVEKIESGLRPDPRVGTVIALAHALGVSLEWLSRGADAA